MKILIFGIHFLQSYFLNSNYVPIMHQSFVSTPPTYRDSGGIAGLTVQCKYFLIVPALPGKCWGYNIGTITPLRFSLTRENLSSGFENNKSADQSDQRLCYSLFRKYHI